MENAIDAIMMAFAMFVLVIALGLGMRTLSSARETADIMITLADPPHITGYEEGTGDLVRTVGLETIIPSLYKYYKEEYMVVFQESNGDPYRIYKTQTNEDLWSVSYAQLWESSPDDPKLVFDEKHGSNCYIATFDIEAETARHEPWTASADIYFKENLDAILQGGVFEYPDDSGRKYDYGSQIGYGGLIAEFKDKQFYEFIGENKTEVFNDYSQMWTTKTKRVIIYREKD